MNIKKYLVLFLLLISITVAQSNKQFNFQFEADSIELRVGETKEIMIKLLDEDGNLAQNPFYVFGNPVSKVISRNKIKVKNK